MKDTIILALISIAAVLAVNYAILYIDNQRLIDANHGLSKALFKQIQLDSE